MWVRLKLVNFQNHGKLTVPFGPGVTTLVGKTGAGKSAVVRALRWVCFNRPSGNSMVAHGAGAAMVSLVTATAKVVRKKGPGANVYALDGNKLVAFGADVPDLVADALSVGPASFQRQHDPLFWIALPPAELTKKFNELTGMADAVRVKAALTSKDKKLAAEGRVLEESVKELRRLLVAGKKFAPLIAANRRAIETGEVAAKMALSFARLSKLSKEASGTKESLKSAVALSDGLSAVRRAGESLIAVERTIAGVEKLVRDAQVVPAWVGPWLEAFAAWAAERDLSAFAYARRGLLEYLLDDTTKEYKAWRTAKRNLSGVADELAGLTPTCPACGSPMPSPS